MGLSVTLQRGKAATSVLRRDVKDGQVFAYEKLGGKTGGEQLVAVGHDGKFLSLNLKKDALASSTDGTKQVHLIGKANYKVTFWPSNEWKVAKRKDVKVGQAFRSATGKQNYGHLGVMNDSRRIAKNFSSADYAFSNNPDNDVVIVGTFQIHAEIVS